MSARSYQNYQGPTDPSLRHSEIEGYQPVSRIGEVVINSFVDSYEFTVLEGSIDVKSVSGAKMREATGDDVETGVRKANEEFNSKLVKIYEQKPHFHEWATALPGMLCVSRKSRNLTFRNYIAAETATPVVTCAACLGKDDEDDFYFAGVCRSKSVRPIDDGVGPSVDEFFTLAIGGMCTLLNNSPTSIFPGDMLEWTFLGNKPGENIDRVVEKMIVPKTGRGNSKPRRITVRLATPASERIIGRALSFSKPGETFDLLIKSC